VQSALAKVEGVKEVKVDLGSGKASVVTDKGKVSAKQLIQAVADIQGDKYKATAQ